MDPLSAVGLAGTIVQFVSFAAELIAVTSDIHDSASGINDEVENIETVYGKLERFSVDLGKDLKIQPQVHDGFAAKLPGYHQQLCAIQELSTSCKNDCDRLLGIIKGLPVERGPKTPWKSFRVALKLVWKSDEISTIDKRLKRTQATLTLHLSDLSNKFHGETFTRYERLEDICRSNHLRQQGQLRDIRQMLDKLAASLHSRTPAVYESQDIASLEQQMSVLSIAMKYTDLQQRIIRSLGFNNRQVRHDKIPEAHIQTFRWAFEQGDKEEAAGERLLHWLQDGSGVFWVSGKPGSGKSTLMKYVADNERTRRALKTWSGGRELIVASHYFWIEGTEMQRSWQGLLQTLLFDIFRQCPRLVEVVCRPKRWAETGAAEFISEPWSIAELREYLDLVKDQTDIPFNFCFFLDGLDEYDGDHLELCQDLLKLSQSPNIKICASSRPWNAFKDAFGNHQAKSLCIHDITRGDIERYTRSRLVEHPRWALLQNQAKNAETLIEDITEKSRGVFLWVFLVTRMLREGLTNDDSFSDLEKRLASFPSDLEEFFKHILDSVEPFYHEKMASALQMALKAKTPLDLLIYSFHYQEFDDEHYAINMHPRLLSKVESRLLREQAARRLNGHCRGLLERSGNQVDFLHRTVADFLRCREISDILRDRCRQDFNPELSILRAYLAWIKGSPFSVPQRLFPGRYNDGVLGARVCSALSYAQSLGEMNNTATSTSFEILDELESFLCGSVIPSKRTDSEGSSISANRLYFRERVVQADLSAYLSEKLVESPEYLDDFDCPALHVLLHSELSNHTEDNLPCPSTHYKTLEVLLDNGHDPNEITRIGNDTSPSKTPWSVFMGRVPTWGGFNSKKFNSCLQSGIFQLFLDNGADPNANVHYGPSDSGKSTACGEFLYIALDPKRRRADEVPYLAALDSFLKHGAFVSGSFLKITDKNTFEHNLFAKLRDGKRDQLAVEIMVRLLCSLREVAELAESHWQALGDIFRGRQFTEIQERYKSNTEGRIDGIKRQLGKRSYQGRDGGQEKRTKWSRM
ncbi:nacht nucleoside triphosphatase [Fusarium albosuccineum]|uniref:Nacht nucleoside triphosphatase n=1 Tax=Fusarium albosuccineum TaxID=1237068 RepID=A0A8H4L2J4_9HYPO|nr:nacht nucleoside triphosphatase [Fusarium albosuccineum]